MPNGFKWGLVNIAILVVIVGAVYFTAGAIAYLLAEPSAGSGLGFLADITFFVFWFGGLMVVAGTVYLTLLWQFFRAHPRFRRWALVLAPLVAAPGLLGGPWIADPAFLLIYWLLPAFAFGLVVRRPRLDRPYPAVIERVFIAGLGLTIVVIGFQALRAAARW